MVKAIEETNDERLKAMAEEYARGDSSMSWGDPEHVACYYAFIAGYSTAARLDAHGEPCALHPFTPRTLPGSGPHCHECGLYAEHPIHVTHP
jgi:hypothetical protein